MKQKRTSYAFLMEMLWVCGFFALSACIFVLAFVKAEQLSRDAENKNHAVLHVQNAIEELYSSRTPDAPGGVTGSGQFSSWFDKNWSPAPEEDAAYILTCTYQEENNLLHVSTAVMEADGDMVYSLESRKNLLTWTGRTPEGRQP